MSGKRWLALLLFIGLFIVYAVVQTVETFEQSFKADGWQEEEYRLGGFDQIAVLELKGAIIDQQQGLLSSDTYDHDLLMRQLEHVFEDNAVKGVILKVSSPGGGVTASDEIYHHIRSLKEEHDKPIYVHMGDLAASGGYYVSAAADQIYATRTAMTGSIGIILSRYNLQELAEGLGIEDDSITSGEYKNSLSPLKEMTEEEREILQSVIDNMYEQFVDVVEEGRDLDRDEVYQLADGRVFSASQALEVGLIDGIGYIDDVIDELSAAANIENPTVILHKGPGFDLGFAGLSGYWAQSGLPGSDWLMQRLLARQEFGSGNVSQAQYHSMQQDVWQSQLPMPMYLHQW